MRRMATVPAQAAAASPTPIWEGPRWTLRAVAGAFLFTAVIFVALPYLESLAVRARPVVRVVPVERTAVALPPPPPMVALPEPVREDVAAPTPELERPAPSLALPVASLDLTPGLEGVRPSFDMDFAIRDSIDAGLELRIFEIHEIDQPPVPLVRLEPIYPRDALLRRLEGEVVVEFVVDEAGRSGLVEVMSSQPGRIFEAAAVRAIERWRFSPGTSGGKPVPVRVRQRVVFEVP